MRLLIGTIFLVLVASCSAGKFHKSTPEKEFRGIWIATVVNIDWPKNGNDTPEKQKKDFVSILDFYEQLNFNAAIVQIRTAGDAFYPTTLAPWSKYLTGKEGRPPKAWKDPLEWLIDETHKRGMEFHAWLNPYRATFDLDTLSLDTAHDYHQHPDWMVKYGKKYYYNPGMPQVRNKFVKVVHEVVANYNIDAIHFDDYFYPYKIQGERFNDSVTFIQYGLPNQNIDDWRRSNIDSLVQNVYRSIKNTKPWVQFGISPFGVWKNKSTDSRGSDTQAGQTTYEDLYADPLLWAKKGWLDYLAPQAYWSLDHPKASHRKIATWWADTVQTTNLYIGNGTYKIKNNSDKAWNNYNEIPKQLVLAREIPKIQGNVFFSAKSLMGKHRKAVRKLKRIYAVPTKNPSLPIMKKRKLERLNISSYTKKKHQIEICLSQNDTVPRAILFYHIKDSTRADSKLLLRKTYLTEEQTTLCDTIPLRKNWTKTSLGIAVEDAYGNESEFQILNQN